MMVVVERGSTVAAEDNVDNDLSVSVHIRRRHSDRPELRLFLHHDNHDPIFHHDDESQITTLSTTVTKDYGLQQQQQHPILFLQQLRGLQSTDTTNSTSMFNPTDESRTFTAGMVVSILSCVVIVILFLWLGYCACWFGCGGYVTCVNSLFRRSAVQLF